MTDLEVKNNIELLLDRFNWDPVYLYNVPLVSKSNLKSSARHLLLQAYQSSLLNNQDRIVCSGHFRAECLIASPNNYYIRLAYEIAEHSIGIFRDKVDSLDISTSRTENSLIDRNISLDI